MFWGNPDASVNFCEIDYTKSNYIAEYNNTLSYFRSQTEQDIKN